jgi:hypothetical protein
LSLRDWKQLTEAAWEISKAPIELVHVDGVRDDPIPSLAEIASKLPDEGGWNRWRARLEHLETVGSLQAAMECETPFAPRPGHGDLALHNALRSPNGPLVVLDWENARVSSLEAELGRLFSEMRTLPDDVAVQTLLECLSFLERADAALDLGSLGSWFGPWLAAHRMFMNYCAARVRNPELATRLKRDVTCLEELVPFWPVVSEAVDRWPAGH